MTPVGGAVGARLVDPKPLIVPVLRAGIGMLGGMTRLLPMASVGFVGMVRDEESLVASTYANRLPARLDGREVFVLDPMLATGGTLITVISMLKDRGAEAVTAICLLAAPEGLARIDEAFPGDHVRVVTGAVDERLNDKGYIVPGLGDAGDRLFGEISGSKSSDGLSRRRSSRQAEFQLVDAVAEELRSGPRRPGGARRSCGRAGLPRRARRPSRAERGAAGHAGRRPVSMGSCRCGTRYAARPGIPPSRRRPSPALPSQSRRAARQAQVQAPSRRAGLPSPWSPL